METVAATTAVTTVTTAAETVIPATSGSPQVPAPADGRISVSGRLDNSGTIEAGGRTDLNVHSELANSGRLTLGSLKADGSRFDNRQGDILAHSADIHSSHSDNRGGALAAGSLKLDGTRLDNRQGVIRSNTLSDIRLSDGLNNQQGEITTAGSLKLAAGDIASSGGSILAGQDLELTANRLDGSGTLAAGRDAALKLSADFDSSGDIEAGRKLSIESGGSIRNRHRLAGGQALDIRARHIDNRAEGKLVSGSNTRIGADTVDNRGLINSNGLTRIDAATALNNIGSGRIYGSRLALGGGSLNNREEASADGKNQAPVIAARERLDIGMRSISNTGSGFGRIENGQVQTGSVSSLISSEGTLHIGVRLNESHQAEGRAERLENRGGRIEAAGDGVWSVAKIHNGNSRWEVNHKVAVGAAEHRHSYSQPGNPEWWQVGKDGSWRQTANHAKGEFTFNDGRAPVRQSSWNEKRVTIQRHEDQIAHSQPGQIAIGGNFTADTQELANENGQILIGGVWQGSDKDSTLKNLSDLAGVYEIESGIFENSYARKSKSRQRWGRRTGYSAPVYNETLLERREFANHISYQDQAGSLNPPAGHAAAADAATAAVAPQRIKSPDGRFSLPESSLYTVRPDRPGYLVETDPAYADYRTWLGSDYMLKALQTDPNRTHKRLGDGYYEQRLINEQIARLTGYRRLDGYPNDEAQFQALMDAGISFARAQQLTPGIALSPEQVARLTSDIVWLESQTVTLADGSSQSVLVPKVYVLARPGDLNSAGGLISADALQLNAGRIDNRGTLAGRRIVDLAAGDISNSGRIGGKNVILDAQQQIDITGGSIEAERLLSLKADNITLQSSTAQSGDSHNGRTTVDRVAGLYVSGTEDGQGLLSLEAGHDIKLNGARLANRAREGHTQVVSRQGSVTLGTVRTESHESYGSLSDKNHRHVHQSAEEGSRIEALGNITVSAGKDLSIRQGQIDSQNGRTTLAARGNIDISEGRRTLDLDESTYSKERGLVGSKSRLDQYRRQHDEAAGSVITGREVRTASGGDTRIRGSQVISDGQTLIAAQGEVRVDAAENRYQDWENHERKKSGLMGSGGIGFFIGNKTQAQESDGTAVSASGSTVGSLKGDTLIAAKRYSQTGSIVSSPEGNVLVEAEKIDIQAADERYRQTQRSRFEQKGLTVAVNIPVVDAAIGLTNAAKSAKQIHGSNSRVNLMAAANAARQGFNAGKTLASVAQNPQSAGQGISVSITYGEQKNTSETQTAGNRAQAARMEAGKAVMLKAHGAGKDSDILIRGADIGGQQATYLSAENRVDIRSAEQQHQERSKNRQSGWNAGVALAFNNGVSLGFTAGGNYGKGYGNGDEATHLHSHIGSRSGQTFVHSGGDTTLKGAQLIGKGVQLDAANLNIESVQDTATFRGKQENMSAQITVGYGFSAGGSYSRSKSSADHASVGEQSGIFAGEDGYQVRTGTLSLTGAALSSTAAAERNRLDAQTVVSRDIHNYSRADASAIGFSGGMSFSPKSKSGQNSTKEAAEIGSSGKVRLMRFDQVSAQDDADNDKYRREKLARGETFYDASLNQTRSSPFKFGLSQNDMHGTGSYALAKLGLLNLFGNNKQRAAEGSDTRSSITQGSLKIADAAGRDTAAALQQVENGHTPLAKIDREGMLQKAERRRNVSKDFIHNTLLPFTDEAYRTEIVAEHRLFRFITDENDQPIENETLKENMQQAFKQSKKLQKKYGDFEQYWQDFQDRGGNIYKFEELSDQERNHLKPLTYTDPDTGETKQTIGIAVNGIFNEANPAAKYALQNYWARKNPKTGKYEQVYKNVHFLHNPEAGNGLSELLVAGCHKLFEGNGGVGLSNSALGLEKLLYRYGRNNPYRLSVGSHSRGTMVVYNTLRKLDSKENAGMLADVDMKMVGPATHVAKADDRLARLQGFAQRGADNQERSIAFENHPGDFVGRIIGYNPTTTETNTRHKSRLRHWVDIFGSGSSPHNCHGIGNEQCVKDGYRTKEDVGIMPKTKRIYGYPHSQPTEQEK